MVVRLVEIAEYECPGGMNTEVNKFVEWVVEGEFTVPYPFHYFSSRDDALMLLEEYIPEEATRGCPLRWAEREIISNWIHEIFPLAESTATLGYYRK